MGIYHRSCLHGVAVASGDTCSATTSREYCGSQRRTPRSRERRSISLVTRRTTDISRPARRPTSLLAARQRPPPWEGEATEPAIEESMSLTPCYPFPAEFSLEVENNDYIMCIRHLAKEQPSGVKLIVLCFPGVHGGVGPCRTPGENYCDDALYPSLARKLTEEYPVNFYRCSWPFMRPRMRYAVTGVMRVLTRALKEAMSGCTDPDSCHREIGIMFVGHSLGGAVAIHAAEVVARHFGHDGAEVSQTLGVPNVSLRMVGLCTLNGAIDVDEYRQSDHFASLSSTRALIVAGEDDQIVPPDYAVKMYEQMPMRSKKLVVLSGASHDLFSAKDQILDELSQFITEELAP